MATQLPAPAIEKINQVIAQWHQELPHHVKCPVIKWDRVTPEEEVFAQGESLSFGERTAQLAYRDNSYGLWLAGNADLGPLGGCEISLYFANTADFCGVHDPELPSADNQTVFNVLHSCLEGVRLIVCRTDDTIVVIGVETYLLTASLTPQTLDDALTRLSTSANLVWGQLVKLEGEDHWNSDPWEVGVEL